MAHFLLHILIFLITGAFIYFGMYYGTPSLLKKGVPLIYAFWFYLWMPVLLLFPLSIVLYLLEGNRLTYYVWIDRFRLHPLDASDWKWVIIGFILTIVLDQLLEPIGKRLARIPSFAPPAYLPAPFNPLKKLEIPPTGFFEVSLKGKWKLVIIFVLIHCFAMFSEELMWRGFILPEQEQVLGQWAWVLNGLLWAWFVHAALKWHFIGMIPSMLIAPWVAHHTESTLASFAVHALGNSPLWILLIAGILKANKLSS